MIPKIIHYCWFGNAPLPSTAHSHGKNISLNMRLYYGMRRTHQ